MGWAARAWLRERTLRWQNGHLSNFEYLLALNTLAGRTESDLTQYPVFPWVLRDYKSERLDLSDPASFRDLSRPMGAQTAERARRFAERYEGWEDASGVPPFHYGTHYSSAALVTSFLVRLQPFAAMHWTLQEGRFDHADRLFHSEWALASGEKGCDTGCVKELIPEFYYLPDFLRAHGLPLGTRQDGTPLGDVVLPPWAGGSAASFVSQHRAALESEHVSQHLHLWVDLVFGQRQSGPLAEEALNVFFYLTYGGAVDQNKIEHAAERARVAGQIRHFGQTPTQLFHTAHPRR
ncbi:BEACH domain-containing protein, partial [Pavlovales sp. CCMP2436]